MSALLEAVARLYADGGWIIAPLLGCGLALWYLLVLRAFNLRLPGVAPLEPTQRAAWIARQRTRLQNHASLIAALIAAAPLLGLLGTVGGMITTFDALTARGDATRGVAGGISTALLTTQLGLGVAVPGLVMAAVLNQRARRLDTRLDQLAVGPDCPADAALTDTALAPGARS